MNDPIIEQLLDHLWLQERLSQNTLDSYRNDLIKISTRLAETQHNWLNAEGTDLASVIYHSDEQPRSQARALSACKRLYRWLIETEQLSINPTRHLKAPKQPHNLLPFCQLILSIEIRLTF